MDYEWDEARRIANLEKDGVDFRDADILFPGAHLVGPARSTAEEDRSVAVGIIGDAYITVIFTGRGATTRVTSMRRARRDERRRHQAIFSVEP